MEQNPHCHWCKRKLKLYPDYRTDKNRPMPSDYPTIDHLYSRFNGPRPQSYNKRVLFLSCPECNNGRSKDDIYNHPIRHMYLSASFPKQLFFINVALRLWRGKKQLNQFKSKII